MLKSKLSGVQAVKKKHFQSNNSKKESISSSSSAASTSASSVSSLLSALTADSPLTTFAALVSNDTTAPAKEVVEKFFESTWEKKPIHIKRNNSAYYRGLFSKAAFDAHVRQNAETLQYGFDMNICVCSDEGKKIDMNPKSNADSDEIDEDGEDEDGEEEEDAPAPVPEKKHGKIQSSASSVTTHASDAKKKKQSAAVDEGVETMTIAEALKLAEQQRQKLKPSSSSKQAESKMADEDDEEDEEDEEEEEDEDREEREEQEQGEDEEEQQFDGTSTSQIRKYAPVKFSAYDELYHAGCTVQALQPQQYTRPMWELLAQLEVLFGGLVGANCYLTPPNSQGLAPHHDDVEVFVLQLEGEKAWKLYQPHMSLPREHSGDFRRDEIGEPFQELLLKPGDLMYMPRGIIHEARTSDTASAHMTISCYQKTSFYDFFKTLFPIALEKAFYSDDSESFRKGLPVNYLQYMGTGELLASSLKEEKGMKLENEEQDTVSPAFPSATRSELQFKMKQQIKNLIQELVPILQENIETAVDEMSSDFMQSRLPPPPPAASAKFNPFAAAAAADSSAETEGSLQPRGPAPSAESRVGFVQRTAMRMVVVPSEEEDDDEEEDEEEGDSGHLLLTHCMSNPANHHLDGRFPPDPSIIAASQIQLPLYYSPAVFQLLRSPKPISVDALMLDLGDMLNSDGEAPSSDEQSEAKLELVQTLWNAGVLECKEEKTAAAANGASKKRVAEGAGTERKGQTVPKKQKKEV